MIKIHNIFFFHLILIKRTEFLKYILATHNYTKLRPCQYYEWNALRSRSANIIKTIRIILNIIITFSILSVERDANKAVGDFFSELLSKVQYPVITRVIIFVIFTIKIKMYSHFYSVVVHIAYKYYVKIKITYEG